MILFLLRFLEDYCKKNAVLAAGRNHSVTVSGIIKYGITGVEYLNMILECYLETAADNIIKFLSLVGREGYGLILILVRIRRGYKEGLAILNRMKVSGYHRSAVLSYQHRTSRRICK